MAWRVAWRGVVGGVAWWLAWRGAWHSAWHGAWHWGGHRAVLGTMRVDEQVGRVRVALEVAVREELHRPRLAAARDEELAVDLVKG